MANVSMASQEFVDKWRRSKLKESAASQSHFNDLAHNKLDEAVLDAYAWPHDLTDEEILERLLAFNLERADSQRTG